MRRLRPLILLTVLLGLALPVTAQVRVIPAPLPVCTAGQVPVFDAGLGTYVCNSWAATLPISAPSFTATETLGPEKVSNGSFTGSATGWTLGAGWAYGTDAVVKGSDGTGTLTPSPAITVVAGEVYEITYTLSSFAVGSVTAVIGGVYGTSRSTAGTYTDKIVAANTGNLTFTPSNTSRFTIDNVSAKLITNGSITAQGNAYVQGGLYLQSAALLKFDGGALSLRNVSDTAFLPIYTGAITSSGNIVNPSYNTNSSRFLATTGTITTSNPAFSATQTWNEGSTVFTGILANFTCAACSASSLPVQIQVDGGDVFKVSKTGTGTFAGSLSVVNTIVAGTAIAFGTNYASTGTIRTAHNSSWYGRDSTNSADVGLIRWGDVANNLTVGSVLSTTRLRTGLATPTSLLDGDWWVDCTGTSPARVCSIKVQDGSATRTIASITY